MFTLDSSFSLEKPWTEGMPGRRVIQSKCNCSYYHSVALFSLFLWSKVNTLALFLVSEIFAKTFFMYTC